MTTRKSKSLPTGIYTVIKTGSGFNPKDKGLKVEVVDPKIIGKEVKNRYLQTYTSLIKFITSSFNTTSDLTVILNPTTKKLEYYKWVSPDSLKPVILFDTVETVLFEIEKEIGL